MPHTTQSAPSHPENAWHHLAIDDVIKLLNVDLAVGLNASEVNQRRQKYGLNKLTPSKHLNELFRFLLQFHQPLLYILLAASGITFFLGEIIDSSVIFGVVFINAVVGYLQEAKAEKAISALSEMVIMETTVRRDGDKKRISSEELVPGDIVILQSGDKIPADIRLFHARNLQVDESALTGESVPVFKDISVVAKGEDALPERINMTFAGTFVTSGQAQGITCLTADQTELGNIAHLTSQAVDLSTPLTRKIAHASKLLLFFILALAAMTFIIGVARGNSIVDMFMAAVALAVGAIPEGLPAAITITLAIGVSRMARRRAIIRNLPASESLGSTTVICSDKTGTLTENQMTVQQIYVLDKIYKVPGSGYEANGKIQFEGSDAQINSDIALTECLKAGLLCNDSQLTQKQGRAGIHGDPTEGALIVAARKGGLFKEDVKEIAANFPRIDTIPFESEHQYMATLHKSQHDQSRIIYVKGSLERVLDKCSHLLKENGETTALDKEKIHKISEEMSTNGLRVLAFALLKLTIQKDHINHDDTNGLTFLGLQGMMDPPRKEAITAVRKCQSAGISVKMITGDHISTAIAIARAIGLKTGTPDNENKHFAISGKELENLSDDELLNIVEHPAVFARIIPEQKLRLVKALKARGHVVAMTGDGVNDAPALKHADIGVAMGLSGTDVAKAAADMVLTDDNFASIEAAVEEGRCVFDNLTKFIVWTLPTNGGEAMVLLMAILTGMALPMLPVQLLWINMMTAILLGLTLVFEPKEQNIMQRPPRDPRAPILTKELLMRTLLVTFIMLIGSNWLFIWAQKNHGADIAQARTIVVNVIVMIEIFYLLNCRSLERSILSVGIFSNLWIIIGIIAMLIAQLLFTYSPVMNRLFHGAPISVEAWLHIITIALCSFLIVETEKWLRRKKSL